MEISQKWDLFIQLLSALLIFGGLLIAFIQLKKGNKLKKQSFYTRLELASNELFRLEIEHPELSLVYKKTHNGSLSDLDRTKIKEYVASLLNLFEIHFRLRMSKDIEPVTFATWMPWIYECISGQLFREIWQNLMIHYDPAFRDFLNRLILIVDDESVKDKEFAFYSGAAAYFKCPVIKKWKSI